MGKEHIEEYEGRSELEIAGEKLRKARDEYVEKAEKAGINGGVLWIDYNDDELIVMTVCGYKDQLLQNIQQFGDKTVFGLSKLHKV